MIRIHRPAEVPAVLREKGSALRDRLRAGQEAASGSGGTADKPTFDSRVYGDPSVRRALAAAQHGKCCYCEARVGTDGDVEHFRPRSGSRQGRGKRLRTPGYYWLAYEWSNLLLACVTCNQRCKRDLFPLAGPARRARSPEDDLSAEEPLLIDPAARDPERHLSFRREVPYAIGDDPPGRETIAVLRLERESLNERRRDRLALLARLYEIVLQGRSAPRDRKLGGVARRAEDFLARALTDVAEFAAMARAAAAAGFHLDAA